MLNQRFWNHWSVPGGGKMGEADLGKPLVR